MSDLKNGDSVREEREEGNDGCEDDNDDDDADDDDDDDKDAAYDDNDAVFVTKVFKNDQ